MILAFAPSCRQKKLYGNNFEAISAAEPDRVLKVAVAGIFPEFL
jgi:hypothetical protein